jgi:hypothetical protein
MNSVTEFLIQEPLTDFQSLYQLHEIVFLESLIVAQVVTKFPAFFKHSLPRSLEPATEPYAETAYPFKAEW